MTILSLNTEKLNQLFISFYPQDILRWAWDTFENDLVVTSSFQSQSVPLLHLISCTLPEVEILFLDTGYHFPETLEFRDQLVQQWGLKVKNIRSKETMAPGTPLNNEIYRSNPDLCCYRNKVKPLHDYLKNKKAWITGIRRDQTTARGNIPYIQADNPGLYKICPFAAWTQKDIFRYIAEHDLPTHPLLSQGYLSVGCAPCTRPIFEGESERAGRWAGQHKIECGIHLSVPENVPHHD